jgi:2Fe-2S ferredoxin
MCATCHVYLDPASAALVAPVSEVENEMLESAASGRRENSRLSCQIVVPAGDHDVIVHVPSHQV